MYVYLVVKPGAVFPDSVAHAAPPKEDAKDA
jgi:hypothetical protein